jgi:opacity protein-like surface antigen
MLLWILVPVATAQTKPEAPFFSRVNTFSVFGAYSNDSSHILIGQAERWAMGEAISPFGLKLNFAPRRKLQPFLIGHGGYMYSTQEIPVRGAGSFNFTFDGGIGVEFYLSNTKSIRADYRYHHLSNNNTANVNPGVDNGILQLTYAFGR